MPKSFFDPKVEIQTVTCESDLIMSNYTMA